LLVVVALVGWLVWPAQVLVEQPRERRYLDFTACVLTDAAGVAAGPAAAVWAGLQDASLTAGVRVQYLAVSGPATARQAGLFATSLAQGGCRLVFAVGDLAVSGVEVSAPHFPLVYFYLVGGRLEQPNVSVVEAADLVAVRAEVARIVVGVVAPG
jgi:basic membrane lipoprotein Med (substrate-binding protein (PBP1-ABC) superfamily)